MRIIKYAITAMLCDDCKAAIVRDEPYLLVERHDPDTTYLICERCGAEDTSHPAYQEYKKLRDAAYGHQ